MNESDQKKLKGIFILKQICENQPTAGSLVYFEFVAQKLCNSRDIALEYDPILDSRTMKYYFEMVS